MKRIPSPFRSVPVVVALCFATASTQAFAQTTAATTPIAFLPITVLGGGSISAPKLSLISPTITQPIAWQGAITAISTAAGNTVLTASAASWVANQFNGSNGNYYVEVVTFAPNTHATGATADITATSSTSITVTGNLTAPTVFAQVGDALRIRKEVTLDSIFGANNAAGFLASDDAATADEVLLYDGATSNSYFYYSGDLQGNLAGWYTSGTFKPSGSVTIGPHQGVVIKRKAAAPLSFTADGTVKTGNTLFPIVTGLNVLGTSSAQGLTLATSGLYTGSASTGVKPSNDPSSADEVTIYNTFGHASYFYYNGTDLPVGWYESATFTSAATVALPPGAAFVLMRKAGPSFNWSLPSPNSFQ